MKNQSLEAGGNVYSLNRNRQINRMTSRNVSWWKGWLSWAAQNPGRSSSNAQPWKSLCIATGGHHSDMFVILVGRHCVKTGYIHLYIYICIHIQHYHYMYLHIHYLYWYNELYNCFPRCQGFPLPLNFSNFIPSVKRLFFRTHKNSSFLFPP